MTDDTFAAARELLDEGAFEDVLELIEGLDGDEAALVSASARFGLGELDQALALCRDALSGSESAEARLLETLILLSIPNRTDALASARRAVELEPDGPDGHHILGLVLTQRGEIEEADRSFRRTTELAPEEFALPYRLEAEAFDRVVEQAVATLPRAFAECLANVEVAVEDVPTEELIRSGSAFDDLGLYFGGSIQSDDWDLPDRILLFQRNLENIASDHDTLIREIHDTVLHEIGHHMGLDEEDLPF